MACAVPSRSERSAFGESGRTRDNVYCVALILALRGDWRLAMRTIEDLPLSLERPIANRPPDAIRPHNSGVTLSVVPVAQVTLEGVPEKEDGAA